ncbi:hypothetical protein ACFVUW_00440 [Streptomyces xiamenensis]
MTSLSGGMVAAAHGSFPLLDGAVRFAAERVLEDGSGCGSRAPSTAGG